LIARACTDVEHALAPSQLEQLADERNHRRLRDRLAAADRKRCIVVRTLAEVRRHEELARHAAHRLEHTSVVNTAADELVLDHAAPRVDHGTVESRVASIASFTSIVFPGGLMPIPSIGTSESPLVNEP
jgi:hypothetical protein